MIRYTRCRSLRTWPTPGTIVSVPFLLILRHSGIVSDRWYLGKPMVISNSARIGGIAEEPWDVFSGGAIVASEGYPSTLPRYEVLLRARSLAGKSYNPIGWNCEHLTRYTHGLEPQSPQAAAILILSLIALGVAAA